MKLNLNFLRHAYQQPLIFATGLAALVHSTWSLGTMFSGEQPAIENITSTIGYVHFAGWIIPALLIAFALDIGQIMTSHDIRSTGVTIPRAITFGVFALATYYLQWLYMAHHMPLVELAEGISHIHRDAALWLRNMGLWLIPALLPLSTLLYTFSSESHIQPTTITPKTATHYPLTEVVEVGVPDAPQLMKPATNGLFYEVCEYCGWESEGKEDIANAKRALTTHQTRHCTKAHLNGHAEKLELSE